MSVAMIDPSVKTQPERQAAFFSPEARAARLAGTPVGQPTPGELDPVGRHEAVQRAYVTAFCLGALDGCTRLCAECQQHADAAINADFCARNPYDCTQEPGRPGRWTYLDAVDGGSPEGRAILARRGAQPPARVAPGLGELAGVMG